MKHAAPPPGFERVKDRRSKSLAQATTTRRTRRSFTPEFRFAAAHRVIDGKERVADVARELALHRSVLQSWVRDEQWRIAEANAGLHPAPWGDQPLFVAERTELGLLRLQVAAQAETIAFLFSAATYFAVRLDHGTCSAHFDGLETPGGSRLETTV